MTGRANEWSGTIAMMTNAHETMGGIIGQAIGVGTWYAIIHGDHDSQVGFETRDAAVAAFIDVRIAEAVDGAHPAGMMGDSAFDAELATRLDDVARCLMGLRSDLEVASLDDWLATNMDALAPGEVRAATAVLEAY